MKFEGIEGEVKGKYKGWIELTSCQLGASRSLKDTSGRGANREASAPSVSEIVVTKDQDSASMNIFRASLWGDGKKVTIDFVKDADAPYLSLQLENVLISSFSTSGFGGDDTRKPMETLVLNFSKISYKTMAAAKDPKATKDMATWQTVQ